MPRTLLLILGLVMTFHGMTSVPSSATAQEESRTPPAPRRSSLGAANTKGKLSKLEKAEAEKIKLEKLEEEMAILEKAEEEIDEDIKEEKKRRENSTEMMGSPSESENSDKANLCNNGLEVDFSRPGSVTLCTCGVNEVLVNGSCQFFSPGTTILAERHIIFTEETPISSYRVRVQDLDCRVEATHRSMTFKKDTFYLRSRGDVVLTDRVGQIAGLRIRDYCIDHFLDEDGSLTWMMKACVPHPVVPRCCPTNHVLRNGICHRGPSPAYLFPLIHADPRGSDVRITWPVVRNKINKLSCGNKSLRAVDLDFNGSYMLALANGLAYRWYSNSTIGSSEFKFCPDFCVDGRQDIDGSIAYQVGFCHTPPKEQRPSCKTDSCFRKCCERGNIMSLDHYGCLKDKDETFEPPVSKKISNYEIIIGKPSCAAFHHFVDSVMIDSKGNLHYGNYALPPSRYCMDTFAQQGTKKMKALVCPRNEETYDIGRTWWKVRVVLLPLCIIISLFFLGLMIGLYLLAPILLKQDGWHQLSYVLSLMLSYSCIFSLNVYKQELTNSGCVALGLLMQFALFSTFFWFGVMCFDIERKIRSLRKFCVYSPLHPMAYVAFGFGGPVLISIITFTMHVTVPFDTAGIVTPGLGISRCWFHGDLEILVYVNGPMAIIFLCNIGLIASTAWNYRKIEKGGLGLAMKSPSENGQASQQTSLEDDRQRQTRKNFAEFKHTFILLALMCFCWITELLSWKIPPEEIWAFTDVLNCLQGLFVFAIFLSNRRNRKILKKRHPRLYSMFQPVKNGFRRFKSLFKKSKIYSNSPPEDGISINREPSISSEFSDVSENNKSTEPTVT